MKTKICCIITLIGICFFSGCIPSLHPLYTKKDLIFVEDLLGTWEDKANNSEGGNKLELTSDKETWRFEKSGEKSYLLTQVDSEGQSATFDIKLIKLGENYFVDFFLNDVDTDSWNDFMTYHLMPVHTFAKIKVDKEFLTIQMFEPDFLEKLLNENKIRIKNEKMGDRYLLTASPEELQKFVTKYAHKEEAFMDSYQMVRKDGLSGK